MKQLFWKLILPLTIISFGTITKWWYVEIADGPKEILTGFPVPYMCPGWHTSGSLQIFVSGLIIDLLFYLMFWFILTYVIHHFIKKIMMTKVLTTLLLVLSVFCLSAMIFIGSMQENVYMFKKGFSTKVLETGYKFVGEHIDRPGRF